MRVLFTNHTGEWSGAEVALMRLIRGLEEIADLDMAVASPAGRLADEVRTVNIEWFELPPVRANFDLHPFRTARGVADLARAGWAMRAAANSFGAQIMHANSLRSGLSGAVAVRAGACPMVVQSHEHLPDNQAGMAIRSVLARSSAAMTAVTDKGVRNLDVGKPAWRKSPRSVRIYPSIEHKRFDPDAVDGPAIRETLGIPPEAPFLCEVAQISPWKGQDVAIRTLAGIKGRYPDAMLALVGHVAFTGTRFDNRTYERGLHDLAAELGIQDSVLFLGQRPDVPAIFAAADFSLLPSWDEPFGLVVAESMAMGTPPMVTSIGGLSEYVEDGISGRVLAPKEPAIWVDAALELLDDRKQIADMSRRARQTAAQFSNEAYARQILALFNRVLKT